MEAMRRNGADFASMHFPVGDEKCNLVVGGFGGDILGLDFPAPQRANNNETTHPIAFEANRWYTIRLRVSDDRVEGWIDSDKKIDFERRGRNFASPHFMDAGWDGPLAAYAWNGAAAIRSIRIRQLKPSLESRFWPALGVAASEHR